LSDWATSSELVRQALKFGLVGVLNTAIGLGVIYALMWGAGMNPFAANVIGYSLALTSSYLVNKAWTFQDKRRSHRQFVVFLLVFGICYGLQMIVLWILIKPLGVNPYISQPLAMVVYTIANFLGSKFVTFRGTVSNQSSSGGAVDEHTVV
jgi:putative flippase GtrA